MQIKKRKPAEVSAKTEGMGVELPSAKMNVDNVQATAILKAGKKGPSAIMGEGHIAKAKEVEAVMHPEAKDPGHTEAYKERIKKRAK